MKARYISITLLFLAISTALFAHFGRSIWHPYYRNWRGTRSVPEVLASYEAQAQQSYAAEFARVALPYPPRRIALIGLKAERQLELWARGDAPGWRHIKTYPVQAASGELGPKLREGDGQVPEGLYRIEHLNPNSSFHLSMKINYPNAFDLKHARAEGRSSPGSDIFIHGNAVSIGCLAMGDPAIEELFVLAALVGVRNIEVIIAPRDFRRRPFVEIAEPSPSWLNQLYRDINTALAAFTETPAPATQDSAATGE